MRVADAIIKLLIENDVEVVFGVPGDTSMEFHNAFSRFKDKVQYIACRDERHAAYMADTYARVSGKPGVLDVPSGGGLLYAIPGLSEATSSSIPMLCFSSDISMSSEGTGALTELKQEEVSEAVTKWNVTIRQAEKVPQIIRKAFRIATNGRPGAVHVSIPENIHEENFQYTDEDFEVKKNNRYTNLPDSKDVAEVVKLIKKANRPLVLAGGGVHLSQGHEALKRFSRTNNIPVATSLNGKGSVDEMNPQSVGVIGVNGGCDETNNVVRSADFVLVLGSKLNNVTTVANTLFQNDPDIVQVDTSEEILELNIKPERSIMCDINSFMKELNKEMEKSAPDYASTVIEWNKFYQSLIKAKFDRIAGEVKEETKRVSPARVVDFLNKTTNEEAVFVVDAGTQNPYMASNYKMKSAGRKIIFDRGHGNLGYALSAAFGARYANSEAKVFSLFGDGSFAMSAGELETARRYNLPIIFILFQNNSYGWIKKLHQLYYNEEYIAVDFGEIDGAKVAEGFGVTSKTITSNDKLEEGIQWALQQDGPVFLDLRIELITDIVPPVTNWREDSAKSPEDRKALTY